jgi:hypothetical protein
MGTYVWQRIRIIKEKTIIVKDFLGRESGFPLSKNSFGRLIRLQF